MELILLLIPAVVLPIGLSLAGLWWLFSNGDDDDDDVDYFDDDMPGGDF